MLKRLTSECVGSFSLVFFGCGSTVIAGGYFCPDMEMVCQAAAFGLASTMLFYVLRPVSGAHFNPAVTVAFAIADRFPIRDLVPYIVAQVAGAIGGAMVLYVVASGRGDVSMNLATLGANGYGAHSPAGYHIRSALIVEALGTFVFVLVNLAALSSRVAGFSGPALIGVSMTLCSLIAIPVTNASMNPPVQPAPRLSSVAGLSTNCGCSGQRRSPAPCLPASFIR
jgi:aquaporin Z